MSFAWGQAAYDTWEWFSTDEQWDEGRYLLGDNSTKEKSLTICDEGASPQLLGGENGIVFPILANWQDSPEQEWHWALRAALYLLGLGWSFMGVAIVADVFMVAIETITAKETLVVQKNGAVVPVKVWNPTVANLTLMALGSSAPEILLSVIEIVGNGFFSGDLGPSTIVGSAAFNLLIIIAVCIIAIPPSIPEGRKIDQLGVFGITAFFSVFAYVWILIILVYSSPDVIEVWEAGTTLGFFPVLVILAYLADIGLFDCCESKPPPLPKGKIIQIGDEYFKKYTVEQVLKSLNESDASEAEKERIIRAKVVQEQGGKPSRAQMRIQATRGLTGGKRTKVPRTALELERLATEEAEYQAKYQDDKKATLAQHVSFETASYSVLECDGLVSLEVTRRPAVGPLMVAYATRPGTATAGEDYESKKGTLAFQDGESTKEIDITIIDDDAIEDDEEFYVDLSLARPNARIIPSLATATVTIIDDDMPGSFGFAEADTMVKVQESDGKVEVMVTRTMGASGVVDVEYETHDLTAEDGVHYTAVAEGTGILQFNPHEMQKPIVIPIINTGSYSLDKQFKIEVTKVSDESGKSLLSEYTQSTVTIANNSDSKEVMDKVMRLVNMDRQIYKLGTSSWLEQFSDALTVGGGDDEDEEDGEDAAPGCSDYILHIISLPWKILFAFIPPTSICNGWCCFVVAITMIGVVTALIGDLASLLGCVIGMEDSFTAITFVALGTSLPDTFASKAAALGDDNADASIGNATGSNSVNVFLGLGLPWTLAAVYWNYIAGASSDFKKRYGYKENGVGYPGTATLSTIGYDYPNGAFIVPAGSLGFSVTVFTICAVLCIMLLIYRRLVIKCELGGPGLTATRHALILVFLWVMYVTLSGLEIYNFIELTMPFTR